MSPLAIMAALQFHSLGYPNRDGNESTNSEALRQLRSAGLIVHVAHTANDYELSDLGKEFVEQLQNTVPGDHGVELVAEVEVSIPETELVKELSLQFADIVNDLQESLDYVTIERDSNQEYIERMQRSTRSLKKRLDAAQDVLRSQKRELSYRECPFRRCVHCRGDQG